MGTSKVKKLVKQKNKENVKSLDNLKELEELLADKEVYRP